MKIIMNTNVLGWRVKENRGSMIGILHIDDFCEIG